MTDRPVYFTPAAWDSLSPAQRELLRHRRMARVTALQAEHHRRYHAPAELAALVVALYPDEDS